MNYGAKFAGGLLGFLGIKPIDDDVISDPAKHVELVHKLRYDQLSLEAKERELQSQALDQLKDAALRMADIDSIFKSEESIAGAAVDALQLSAGALKNLSGVMKQAANIWKDLEDHCRTLAEHDVPLESVQELSSDKRLALWSSDTIKEQYVRQSAQWLAMYVVCKEVGEEVKKTKHQLHEFIRENPTNEESRKIIGELSNEFIKDLEHEKISIERKIKNGRKEMDELKNNKLVANNPQHDEM